MHSSDRRFLFPIGKLWRKNLDFSFLCKEKHSSSLLCFSSLRISFTTPTEHFWHFWSLCVCVLFPPQQASLRHRWVFYSFKFWHYLPGEASDLTSKGSVPKTAPYLHFRCQLPLIVLTNSYRSEPPTISYSGLVNLPEKLRELQKALA